MSRIWMARYLVLACCSAVLGSNVTARQVALDVSLAQPTLEANKQQTTFIKVGVTGFRLSDSQKRAPVNIALVLDKSGSMAGDKIARAKEAAIGALERLGAQDIVSVITYDTNVSVLVPATKLTDREQVIERIRSISASGSTALFAGVSKGAEELRKFLDKERVNRVILLSDGLANVGPQSPSELGELGASLGKEGISVTTIGLGLDYNEDLMTMLARKSDGNHVFVENSAQLVDVFNREFNEVLSVVAQEVVIKIHCHDDVRPVRILNDQGEITGQDVYVKLNQLYSEQEKYLILEVELPPRQSGTTLQVADVTVSYTNMESKTEDRLSSAVGANFSNSLAAVKSSVNKAVMEECVLQIANLTNQSATLLRDQGEIQRSKELLKSNAGYLLEQAKSLNSPKLQARSEDNFRQADWVENDLLYRRGRKVMRALQYGDATQQSVAPVPEAKPQR